VRHKKIILASILLLTFLLFLPDALAITDMIGDATGNDVGYNGYIYYAHITPSGNGTIDTIGININSTDGNIRLAIYNDSGGVPDSLLGESSSTVAVNYWNDLALGSSVNVSTGNQYWLAVQFSSASCRWFQHTGEGANKHQSGYAYSAFPSTASPDGDPTSTINMRMNYTGEVPPTTTTTTTTTIPVTNIPISSCPYTISVSGSYYLTNDIATTGNPFCININANNVNLNLSGYGITCSYCSFCVCDAVDIGGSNITIHDGRMYARGFVYGGEEVGGTCLYAIGNNITAYNLNIDCTRGVSNSLNQLTNSNFTNITYLGHKFFDYVSATLTLFENIHSSMEATWSFSLIFNWVNITNSFINHAEILAFGNNNIICYTDYGDTSNITCSNNTLTHGVCAFPASPPSTTTTTTIPSPFVKLNITTNSPSCGIFVPSLGIHNITYGTWQNVGVFPYCLFQYLRYCVNYNTCIENNETDISLSMITDFNVTWYFVNNTAPAQKCLDNSTNCGTQFPTNYSYLNILTNAYMLLAYFNLGVAGIVTWISKRMILGIGVFLLIFLTFLFGGIYPPILWVGVLFIASVIVVFYVSKITKQ